MSSDATPQPPRRRKWLKGLIILGSCLLSLFLIWGVAWIWSGGELSKEIDAIRARGEPVTLAEMAPKPLPPDRDAAVLIRQAIGIYEANVATLLNALETQIEESGYSLDDSGKMDAGDLARNSSLQEDYRPQLDAIRDAARPAVKSLRKARGLDSYDLGFDFANPNSGPASMSLSLRRPMGRFVFLMASEAHHRGDDAEAVELLRDLFTLSRDSVQEPLIVTEMVARYIEGLAASQNSIILHELKIGQGNRFVSREAAKELMVLLLDRNLDRKRRVRCVTGQRAWVLGQLDNILSGRASRGGMDPFFPMVNNDVLSIVSGPALRLDAADYFRTMSSYVEAVREDGYRSACSKVYYRPVASTPNWYASLPFSGARPPSPLYLTFIFAHMAQKQMAGLAVAIRMYEVDKGHKVPKLEDLIPDYLGALPEDPFDPNGGPIRMGQWGGRELLYSVGVVGKDLDGQYGQDPNIAPLSPEKYNWPFFLRGDGPREKVVKIVPASAPSAMSRPGASSPETGNP